VEFPRSELDKLPERSRWRFAKRQSTRLSKHAMVGIKRPRIRHGGKFANRSVAHSIVRGALIFCEAQAISPSSELQRTSSIRQIGQKDFQYLMLVGIGMLMLVTADNIFYSMILLASMGSPPFLYVIRVARSGAGKPLPCP
jgi:hypothetical protein